MSVKRISWTLCFFDSQQ